MSTNAKNAEEFAREILAAFESMSDAPGVQDVIPLLRDSVKRIEKYGICPFAEYSWENKASGSLQDLIDGFGGREAIRRLLPV
jgi:hypothetical protein